MADGPVHYGSGHEDLDREIAALDKIAPKVDDFNKRRAAEVDVTDRSTGRLKANTKALEENAVALERQAEAVRKLSDAQGRLLGRIATEGQVTARGPELHTARALQRMGLVEGATPVNGPFGTTDVGSMVAQQRGLIQSVAIAAASAAAVGSVAAKAAAPAGESRATRARRDVVSREAIAAEEDAARASRELASASRQEAAARLRSARAALAREGATAGTLGVFATGAGQSLRFGIREGRTGQRVSGSFQTREAAEARIAALQAEVAPAVAQQAAVQREIGVTAGRELAVRQKIVAALVRYEAALNAEPVIPESRQIGAGGGLLPQRHPLLFGQRDYGPRYGMYGGRGVDWEYGPGQHVPAGQNEAYDRWRQYYTRQPPPGRSYSQPYGGTGRGPLMLDQFTASSHAEHADAVDRGTDSYIHRVRAAEEAKRAMDGYAAAEARAAAGTRHAAAEFGTADRSMYRHGALATEFIAAAYRGEVTMRDLGKQVALTVGKFGGWTVAASLVYGAARAISTLGNGAMASNSAVAELGRYINGLNTDRAREQLRHLSEDMNVDLDTAAQQFTAAARLTGNIRNPRQAQDSAYSIARTTLLLSRVGDLDPDTAMRYTQAITTGFKLSSDQLSVFIDQLNQLQNNMNIPFDVSAQAVATAAGVWRGAGGSQENLAALVAAARRGSGFSGQILGTTFSRAATMIGRPTNRSQLAAFGIDPDANVDQIFEQAMRLVETHQVVGRGVIRLGTALSSPQLAGRGIVAALQNPAQYRRAQQLEDPNTARGSAERELSRMLKSWREQIIAIANGMRQLGGALEQSGLLAPLGIMLKTLNSIADVVQFLIGGFNHLLPPGLRQGVALLLEGAAAVTVMRRLGAFRAEGRLVQAFPQLAAFERPENQIRGLAVRGARTQVEEAERERESAARAYSSSRIQHEVMVQEQGERQTALRAMEARGVAPGTHEHAKLSRDISDRSLEIEHAEAARAAALRRTVTHQKVVLRAQQELRDLEGMSAAEVAFYARASGLPLPASLRMPEAHGARTADRLKQKIESVGTTGRPADVLRYIDDVDAMVADQVTRVPSARERFAQTGVGQKMSRVRQAMAAEIRSVHENLRATAFDPYVYQPSGASTWDGGYEDAHTVTQRALDADRPGERVRQGAARAAYRTGQRFTGLASGAAEMARNSRVLSGGARAAERALNGAVSGIDAAIGGMRRTSGGLGNLWRSMGVLDKVFIGFAAYEVVKSLTDPSRDAIQRDYEKTMHTRVATDAQSRARLARQPREGVTGGDIDRTILAGAAQILNPTQWDDIAGGRDAGSLMRAAIDRRNADRQNARVILQVQRQARARGQAVPFRFYGETARDARALMSEQAAGLVTPHEYARRADKLRQEFESGSPEGKNRAQMRTSQQRMRAVMAQMDAAQNDTMAVRMDLAKLDDQHLAQFAQNAIANVQSYGLSGTRSRTYLLQAREAYRSAVEKYGGGTPEQLAALAQQREQFFQGIAQTADADLQLALGRAGGDERARSAAFTQAGRGVRENTIDYVTRGLQSARSQRTRAQGRQIQARAGVQAARETGDQGALRTWQRRLRSANVDFADATHQVGIFEQENEQMGRLLEADALQRRDAAFQDRTQGRQIKTALAQSRTGDPVEQARIAARGARQDYNDALKTYGRNSRESRAALTTLNQANTQIFQSHLQDIQSQGGLRVAEGTRDTVGRARNTLAEARRALNYARQHRRAHPTEYREALKAVIDAENALGDAVRERSQQIIDLQGQVAAARAGDDPLIAANAAMATAQAMTIDPTNPEVSRLQKTLATLQAGNQQREARRDLHAAQGEYRASVSGDPRDQARAELTTAQQEVRDATRGTAAWYRALARVNQVRRQVQQADADMASARLELRRAGTDDPVRQARIDEQIARQAIHGTVGAERIRARARLREAHRNTLQTSVQAREDTVDFNLAMEKITADQAATQLESLARAHGIGKQMRRQLLQRAHELRQQSEQEASGFALDVGTIKLPTIYDVRRAMAPLRAGADLAAAGRMQVNRNVSIGSVEINDVQAAERFAAWFDDMSGSGLSATMRSVQMR